ncbi:MAG: T9SS type A sorting domain-containing protein [Chlorobi bacterium]|nr:T9SS type A sorting domain-containing protein [Chlorobiota bacterium]
MSSDISGNLVIAGIFNDTLTMGGFQIIEMDEYHNFLTKIKWTGTTGENEMTGEGVRVFPNPAKDKIKITILNDNEILSFEIVDKYGRKLVKKEIRQNGEFIFNTSDLSPGIYFIYFYTQNKNVISEKIIVL